MKITHAAAKVAVIAAVLLGLMEGRASAASDPIPGIDIIVRKHPDSGGSVMHATTDKSGKFAFDNLKAGTYELSVNVPQTKSSINTSRSNIKHTLSTTASGVEVSVALGTGQPAPVEIKITKDGGKITGIVVDGDVKSSDASKKATKATGVK